MLITDWGSSSVPCKDEDLVRIWVWCLEPTFKKAGTVRTFVIPVLGIQRQAAFWASPESPGELATSRSMRDCPKKYPKWVDPEKWHLKLTSNPHTHVHMCLYTCKIVNSILNIYFILIWGGVCARAGTRSHAGAFRGQKRIYCSRRCRQSWAIQCGP